MKKKTLIQKAIELDSSIGAHIGASIMSLIAGLGFILVGAKYDSILAVLSGFLLALVSHNFLKFLLNYKKNILLARVGK